MGFVYTALAPPLNSSRSRASLLELDGVRILADPGLSPSTDINQITEELKYLDEAIHSVDLILLSHPSIENIGLYAALCAHTQAGRLNIPVYATSAVVSLGQMATLETYRSLGLIGPVAGCCFEVSQITKAFDAVMLVKHSQTVDLRSKFDGLTITALNAGHSLGGTMWLLKQHSTTQISYAPKFNHARDSFLSGADFFRSNNNKNATNSGSNSAATAASTAAVTQAPVRRSDVMICGSELGSSLAGYKTKVEKFLELIGMTLGNGGTVFLPTSVGTRFLELISLIDEHLRDAPIPVLLLAHTKGRVLDLVGSLQEQWCSPQFLKKLETLPASPFDSSKVDVVDIVELMKRHPGAKIVFATGKSCEAGSFAEQALAKLCGDQSTTVFLTEQPEVGTLGHQLFEFWKERSQGGVDGTAVAFEGSIEAKQIVETPLRDEAEIEQYKELIKERRELLLKNQKELENQQNNKNKTKKNKKKTATSSSSKEKTEEEDESESDDDSESEDEDKQQANNQTPTTIGKPASASITANGVPAKQHPIDVDVRSLKLRSKKLFPFVAKLQQKSDDYGLQMSPQQFVRVEEKPDFLFKNKQQQQPFGKNKRHAAVMLAKEKRQRMQKELPNSWNEGKNSTKGDLSHLESLPLPSKTGTTTGTAAAVPTPDAPAAVPVMVVKLSVEPVQIHAKCALTFIDLQGLADLRSYLGLLTSLKPRNVILLPPANNQLTQALTKLNKFEVIQSQFNTPCHPTNLVQSLELLMDEDFAQSLKWQRIGNGYAVAHVFGAVLNNDNYQATKAAKEDEEVAKEEKEEEEEEAGAPSKKKQKLLHLTTLPQSTTSTAAATATISQSLAIGEISLPSLRRQLVQLDYKVEFKGEGTLVVDDCCIVRKISDGEIIVDSLMVGGTNGVAKAVRGVVRGMLAYV